MGRTFSVNYYLPLQIGFEKALEQGEFSKAREILDGLPRTSDKGENIKRIVTLAEGYKALLDRTLDCTDEERDELERYRGLGELDELSRMCADCQSIQRTNV